MPRASLHALDSSRRPSVDKSVICFYLHKPSPRGERKAAQYRLQSPSKKFSTTRSRIRDRENHGINASSSLLSSGQRSAGMPQVLSDGTIVRPPPPPFFGSATSYKRSHIGTTAQLFHEEAIILAQVDGKGQIKRSELQPFLARPKNVVCSLQHVVTRQVRHLM